MLLGVLGKGVIGRKGLRLLQHIIKVADLLWKSFFNVYIFWFLEGKKKKGNYDNGCERERRY